MKKIAWVVGGLVGALVLLVLVARVIGFDPGPTRPGLWLRGELVTAPVTDWSFAEKVRSSAIQTRQSFLPWLAHSVTTSRFHHKGRLYWLSGYPAGVKMPDGRHWNQNVLADPSVRIRLGNKLYDRKLVYVTDPVEREELMRALGTDSDSMHRGLARIFWAPGFYQHFWRVEPRD